MCSACNEPTTDLSLSLSQQIKQATSLPHWRHVLLLAAGLTPQKPLWTYVKNIQHCNEGNRICLACLDIRNKTSCIHSSGNSTLNHCSMLAPSFYVSIFSRSPLSAFTDWTPATGCGFLSCCSTAATSQISTSNTVRALTRFARRVKRKINLSANFQLS